MKYFISNLIPHTPKHIIRQDETIKWLKEFHSPHLEKLIEKYSKGIASFEPRSHDLFNIQTKRKYLFCTSPYFSNTTFLPMERLEAACN